MKVSQAIYVMMKVSQAIYAMMSVPGNICSDECPRQYMQ